MAVAVLLFSTGCNKDSGSGPEGNLKIGITDTRATTTKAGDGIIDASKLSKFEITISKIELLNESGGVVSALGSEVTVDLRSFQGSVKDLATLNAPLGKYTALIIYYSGISVTYAGNTYTSSVGNASSLTIGELGGQSFPTDAVVSSPFATELRVELFFDFELNEELNNRNLNLTFDVVASCYEIEFDCPVCINKTQLFVGLRPIFIKHLNIYFEEGIQQIKHSPPLGIELVAGGTSANYYGIHTFVDFNREGGAITSHSSQHVYRGKDGALKVPIGTMQLNESTLTPNTVSATGTTDVRADEVFDFVAIGQAVSESGYTLIPGETYYFSLKKSWTIETATRNYTYERMGEPIPVLWPPI